MDLEELQIKALVQFKNQNPAGNYMLKINDGNTRTRFKICSKLQKKHQNDAIGAVNFEHITHLVLVFLLLTLSR